MIARTTAWLQTPSQPTALAQLQAVTGLPGAAQNQREIKPLTLAPGPITHKIRVANALDKSFPVSKPDRNFD